MAPIKTDDLEMATILIESVTRALAHGTRHYNAAGKLLTTPQEVLVCLLEEGHVELRDPEILT